jgi:oxygen-dependent protoporphyrinogen oxidase
MTQTGRPLRVAIVGGGIAGLAAAYFLRDAPASVTVFEGSARLGGKLAVSEVAGIPADEGAEALLARRPEGTGLIRAVGLAGELETPGTTSARLWTRGTFREMPRRQLMGVPADFGELARTEVLSAAGLARARHDADLPATPVDGDVAVASAVSARLGREVVDRLVDPLLGGVYAGRSEDLSFEATIPALAAAARQHRSLAEAAASLLPPPQPGNGPAGTGNGPADNGGRPQPVFTTLARGLGTLPAAVAEASGATVRTGAMVRELHRTPGGWRLVIGPASAPEIAEADAVVLAVPARPAGRLLSGTADSAAAALGEISYASMAIVTLAYPAEAFGAALTGSGYLVPAVDGRAVKAVTFSTVKWPHLRPSRAGGPGPRGPGPGGGGMHIVRCSIGRIGEDAILQRDDAELASLAARELALATGVSGPPAEARVTRWGGALPQYNVGHARRVSRIRAAVAVQPGLAVCGAAYDGLGIPACVATARAAAGRVLAHLSALTGGQAGGQAGDQADQALIAGGSVQEAHDGRQ